MREREKPSAALARFDEVFELVLTVNTLAAELSFSLCFSFYLSPSLQKTMLVRLALGAGRSSRRALAASAALAASSSRPCPAASSLLLSLFDTPSSTPSTTTLACSPSRFSSSSSSSFSSSTAAASASRRHEGSSSDDDEDDGGQRTAKSRRPKVKQLSEKTRKRRRRRRGRLLLFDPLYAPSFFRSPFLLPTPPPLSPRSRQHNRETLVFPPLHHFLPPGVPRVGGRIFPFSRTRNRSLAPASRFAETRRILFDGI